MSAKQSYLELEKIIEEQKQFIKKIEGQLLEFRCMAIALQNSSDAITIQDFNGNIKVWNKGAQKMYGWTEAQALAMNINEIVPPYKSEEALLLINKIAQGKQVDSFETKRLTADGRVLDVWISATALVDEVNRPVAVATAERDISLHKQSEKEKNNLIIKLQKANSQLEKALAETKTLRGIIPICMICKQIRNDKGYWEQVDVYVHNHSEANFSHGICPDCLKEKYPKIYRKNKLLVAPSQRKMLEF